MATGSEQCCVLVFHFDLGGLLSTVRQDFFLCGKKTTVVRSLFSRSAAGLVFLHLSPESFFAEMVHKIHTDYESMIAMKLLSKGFTDLSRGVCYWILMDCNEILGNGTEII